MAVRQSSKGDRLYIARRIRGSIGNTSLMVLDFEGNGVPKLREETA